MRNRPRHYAVTIFVITASVLNAEITLHSDFENASLGAWSQSGNTIRLTGEATWTEFPSYYRWVHFRAQGVAGESPVFRIGSFSNEFLGDLTDHRFVYSYDRENWQFFQNNSGNSRSFTFSNSTAFSEDAVYIAYSTPYLASKTAAYVNEVSQNWFVSPTTSSTPNFEIGRINDLPLHGLKITNPLSNLPKTKFILLGGNHSAEMGGSFALQGLLDFITDTENPQSQALRDVAEFYVYPQVDPLGRNEGYSRGNSQNPLNDHNRYWDALQSGNDGGFSEIPIFATAMRQDTDSQVDYAFDFHGFFDSGPDFIYSDSKGSEGDFIRHLRQIAPEIGLVIDDRIEPKGIFEFWAKTPEGLNAEFSFTPEFSPNRSADEWLSMGLDYGTAIFQTLGNPVREASADEIDRLSEMLQSETKDLTFDFDKDEIVNVSDLNFFVRDVLRTHIGDANLDGEFNSQDFVQAFVAGEYEDNLKRNSRWATGDWNGDFEFTSADFVAAFQFGGYEQGPLIVNVPEPRNWMAAISFIAILQSLILCRRG